MPSAQLLPVFLALATLLACACGSSISSPPPSPPLVKVFQPEDTQEHFLALRGTVAPEGRLRLGFRLPGILASLHVREGDTVSAGTVLATLDRTGSAAQLQASRARLDSARREAERCDRLAGEGILPRSQQEEAHSQLQEAEAGHRQCLDDLERTTLRAPAAGTIHQRLSEPGEALDAGSPVLVLDTTPRLVIRAGVTAQERAWIRVGQEARFRSTSDASDASARIRSIGASPDETDGLYAVELESADLRLQAGSLVDILIPCASRMGASRIPYTALVHRAEGDVVFVLQEQGGEQGSGQVVRARTVTVESIDAGGVVLREHLERGIRVIAEGAFCLEDGQAVRILE